MHDENYRLHLRFNIKYVKLIELIIHFQLNVVQTFYELHHSSHFQEIILMAIIIIAHFIKTERMQHPFINFLEYEC